MTVNATKPEHAEGSVQAQVAWIIEQAQAEGLQLTGAGGLLPNVIKQAVEAFLQAEMTDHLGYDKHAAEGRGSVNSRNGWRRRRCRPQRAGGCAGASEP